jgi:hypothetical protein
MAETCGGCLGKGSHRRWCPVLVGTEASRLGTWAEQAEGMGDQVGSNCPAAANHLYRASALLRARAREEIKYTPE